MDIYDYLISLPPETLDVLYTDVWASLAIFRSLPAIAKQYVMRMIFLTTPLSVSIIDSWIVSQAPNILAQHQQAIKRLRSLRIFLFETNNSPNSTLVSLNPRFQKELQLGLLKPDQTVLWNAQLPPDKRKPTRKKLSQYAVTQWESILHFMVDSPASKTPSEGMIQLLKKTNLMVSENEEEHLRISSQGFQFLLKNTYTQLWILLLSYLETTHERGMNKQEVLSFIFQLSFLQLGKDYPVEGLTATKSVFLLDLKEFGLIYQSKDSSRRFYPTKLAIHLCSSGNLRLEDDSDDESEEESSNHKGKRKHSSQKPKPKKMKIPGNPNLSIGLNTSDTSGWIIVETNFQVYAHTFSSLKISLLAFFVKLQYRIADLVTGVITRKSVREALTHGITANQIISFLEQNAHPKMRERHHGHQKLPILPPVVSDQIRLWESERNRLTFTKGTLFEQFSSAEGFRAAVNYAKSIEGLVWNNEQKMLLFCTEQSSESVKTFLKQRQIS